MYIKFVIRFSKRAYWQMNTKMCSITSNTYMINSVVGSHAESTVKIQRLGQNTYSEIFTFCLKNVGPK